MKYNVVRCMEDGTVSRHEENNIYWGYSAKCDCCKGDVGFRTITSKMPIDCDGRGDGKGEYELDLCGNCVDFLHELADMGVLEIKRMYREWERKDKVSW